MFKYGKRVVQIEKWTGGGKSTLILMTVPQHSRAVVPSSVFAGLPLYKRRREGAESGVVLLSVRYGTIGLCIRSKRGAAFSEAFSHSKLLSTKNEPQEKS